MRLDYNLVAVCVGALIKLMPDVVAKEVQKQIKIGPRGLQGLRGLTGDQGKIGFQGIKGDTGQHGKPGVQGVEGVTGKNGKDGKQGLTGVPGFVGLRGQAGFDGKPGPQGEKGIIGNVGPQGDRGPQGETGPAPKHEWLGFKLRFENPDGSWGKYTDLKGPKGDRGDGTGALFDGFNYGDLFIVVNNYTTSGNERIICNAPLTVFLNPQPFNDETVFIKRMNGEVTIDGNGHNIDDDPTAIMTVEYTTLRLTYAGELQQWVIT